MKKRRKMKKTFKLMLSVGVLVVAGFVTTFAAEEDSISSWAQKIKIKGDLRLRYQTEDKEGSDPRVRNRIRFRLQGKADVAKGLNVGFGLATGGVDPRSTNETLDNNFETPDIRLDYAYAKYVTPQNMTLLGGKIPNKLLIWKPADLLWDGDINLDGAGIILEQKKGVCELALNSGVFVLDEINASDKDPLMYVIQGKAETETGIAGIKLAAALYGFENVKGSALDLSAGTNSTDVSGNLIYNYDSIGVGAEVKLPGIIVPVLCVFGEGIVNNDTNLDQEHKTGYLVGLKIGDKKIKSSGQWQVKYMYRDLQKDAWLDIFPDSDSMGGETGIYGSEFVLNYGLAKNTLLGVDHYNMMGEAAKVQTLTQVDLKFKF
jgi:hypothetical protein